MKWEVKLGVAFLERKATMAFHSILNTYRKNALVEWKDAVLGAGDGGLGSGGLRGLGGGDGEGVELCRGAAGRGSDWRPVEEPLPALPKR
jgi:hypothetical protein